MTQLFTIHEDKIVIDKLFLTHLEGTIQHLGQLTTSGPVNIQTDLSVGGILNADTIRVKNLITDTLPTLGSSSSIWTSTTEEDLHGQGLSWTWGDGNLQLAYRKGGKLWTNGDIDLASSKSYKIDNVEVIGLTQLGSQISKSNLKEVGKLRKLDVIGDTTLGEFACFKSVFSRLGLNTEEPNATLSIVEENVEIVIGAPNGSATIGTFTNHDLSIITDNIPRITLKQNGNIFFGNELSRDASVTILGTLYVDNIIANNRVDRQEPLEFKTSRDANIYGQGLLWTGTGSTRQFVMRADPDRLWSTESIDTDKSYYINGREILSDTTLGESVISSNLTKVGILESLSVQSDINLNGNVRTSGLVEVINGDQALRISPVKLTFNDYLSFNLNDNEEIYYVDKNEITIGNKLNQRRPVKLFGAVSIGINTPDNDVSLAVSGDVKFNNKKFINGVTSPQEGKFYKGDICWNQDPKEDSYIGWVCIADGTPGTWAPFGAIGRQ